jgi:hypothetical protein
MFAERAFGISTLGGGTWWHLVVVLVPPSGPGRSRMRNFRSTLVPRSRVMPAMPNQSRLSRWPLLQ